MMKLTNGSVRGKFIAVIVAAVFGVAATGIFAGCGGETEVSIPLPALTPPESVQKVHSVVITHNNADVNGLLSVDLSLGVIKLDAVVSKDDGATGTLTFKSSNPAVATVENDGTVTLVGAGDTVITAKYGTEDCRIVLAVERNAGNYTVTVEGGRADASAAFEGDIITLTAVNPEHKTFSHWIYADSETPITWISGNTFKMPDGDVTVKAEFTDVMYTMRLVGGKVTGDGGETVQEGKVIGYDGGIESEQTAITEYRYAYDTELSFSAIRPAGGDEKMFVGWDEDAVNNRNEDMEEVVTDYRMTDRTVTYYANYSQIKTRSMFSNSSINRWLVGKIDGTQEGADPDLEGLSGFTLSIPSSTKAEGGYSATYISGSQLDTVNNLSQACRTIFKNRGDKPITVELYVSYVGHVETSGWVTVPAGGTVIRTFVATPGFQRSPSWNVSIRRDVGSVPSSQPVPLDIVLGAADAYPKGDKYVGVDEGTVLATSRYGGWSRPTDWPSMSEAGLNYGALPAVTNAYGSSSFYGLEHSFAAPYVISNRLDMRNVSNDVLVDGDGCVTVYARMINWATDDHSYKFRFFLSTTDAPVRDEEYDNAGVTKRRPVFGDDGKYIMKNKEDDGVDVAWIDITFTRFRQTELIALRIPVTLTTVGDKGSLYFGIIKFGYDTPDGAIPDGSEPKYSENFTLITTFNNGLGFDGRVIGTDGKEVS